MAVDIKFACKTITSKSNPAVVNAVKLTDKKYREKEKMFRADGIKLLCEAVEFGAEIQSVFVREDAIKRVSEAVKRHFDDNDSPVRVVFTPLSENVFGKVSEEKAPEGVLTIIKYLDGFHLSAERESVATIGRTIVLESVRDPGNLGTILRSAAAFGFETVIMSSDCADVYNPKTIRAAMGAIFKIRTTKTADVAVAVDILRKNGRRVYAAALDKSALRLGETVLLPSDVFLIGNEGHGLSEETISHCDRCVFIPINSDTESLNAATAASICMWEISKAK